ncbi:adenylate/guanylate cyclase domain-containing protein [Floridanema aerugineum]|uniref:Adenylate/guanylate cyclase domain-containing protein n=1 Tax=Floridaenema aerugineum BLCC-F46 TaxID=3153654 RepID=A0ABV4XGJ7_9CYAN
MSENVITMVFTDLVSSTAIKLKLPGKDISENNRIYRDTILLPHRHRVESSIAAYGGRKVETIGDAFFLVFANPVEAVQWASIIQISHINEPIPTPLGPLQVTIGMHTGSPLADDERFIGHEVDYAARVAALASAGQILLSEATEVLVRLSRSTNLVTHRHSDRNLKGIGSVPIFEVLYNNKQPQPLKDASPPKEITNIPETAAINQVMVTPNLGSTDTQTPAPKLTISTNVQKQLESILIQRIGPMAKFAIEQALEQVITREDLLKALVIIVPEQLQEQFHQEAKNILELAQDLPVSTQTQATSPVANPQTTVPETIPPATIESSFVEFCQIELAKLIGPMANLIIKQTISSNPKLNQYELVDTLAAKIPNSHESQEFRQIVTSKMNHDPKPDNSEDKSFFLASALHLVSYHT